MTLTDHTGTPRRDTVTPEWIEILDGLGYARTSEMAVAGDLAVPIAHLIQDAGGPPLALEWDAFAILSSSGPPDIPEPEGPDDTRLPAGTLDFVIVRHGWGSAAGVAAVVDEAARILRPGGVLVLGDLDFDRLMRGRTRSYASKLLYQRYPAIARQIRAGLAMITDLSTELVRAGFGDVTALVVDETLGRYDDPADFLVAVRHNGWRGIADLEPGELDRLVEELERLRGAAPDTLRGIADVVPPRRRRIDHAGSTADGVHTGTDRDIARTGRDGRLEGVDPRRWQLSPLTRRPPRVGRLPERGRFSRSGVPGSPGPGRRSRPSPPRGSSTGSRSRRS
jgi:SAM-dependent methyltransferase